MVWPSGADFATRSAATLVPPPGLFSITTCWFHILDSGSATRRAATSVGPPGARGTINRTKRLGQTCAEAERVVKGASAAAAVSSTILRRVIMSSLTLDAGRLDDGTPQLGLGPHLRGKLFRRRSDNLDANVFEPFLDGRFGQSRDRIVVELFDDRDRCLDGHEQAVPGAHVETGQAGFRDRREFHCGRKALGGADREPAHLPCTSLLQHSAGGVEHHVDASGDDVI